jgi:hypothetical protein
MRKKSADYLHEGLTDDMPKSSDASTNLPKGPSVNANATRKDVGKVDKAPGARKA